MLWSQEIQTFADGGRPDIEGGVCYQKWPGRTYKVGFGSLVYAYVLVFEFYLLEGLSLCRI